jgi:flagellar biosynthesis GTPase FlhF
MRNCPGMMLLLLVQVATAFYTTSSRVRIHDTTRTSSMDTLARRAETLYLFRRSPDDKITERAAVLEKSFQKMCKILERIENGQKEMSARIENGQTEMRKEIKEDIENFQNSLKENIRRSREWAKFNEEGHREWAKFNEEGHREWAKYNEEGHREWAKCNDEGHQGSRELTVGARHCFHSGCV